MDKCAACGQICLGHETDSINQIILIAHASEDHSSCHPDGCSSVGRSFHAHVCTNCGGDTPCVGIRTASTCDTFDGFCKTCFVELSRSDYIVKSAEIDATELNEHRRMRNTAEPPVTESEVKAAETGGITLKRVRKNFGPHRPTEKAASIDCETCGQPSFVCNCADNYGEAKFASNECGTCGHGWVSHGNSQTCSCCKNFKKASVNNLPDWLREAAIQTESDAKIIDLDSRRKKDPRQEAMQGHPSMQAPKKQTELYDQDDELKLYDQDREVNPIPNKETDKTKLTEQMKAIGDWLGLTDNLSAPYDRRTNPREYGL